MSKSNARPCVLRFNANGNDYEIEYPSIYQAKKLLLSLLPQKNTPFEESINDAAIVARMLGYAHLDATIKELDNANSN